MARRSQKNVSDKEFILQSLGVHDTDGRLTVENPDGLRAALGDDDVLTVFPDGTAVLSANQPMSLEDYQEQIVEGHHPLLGRRVTFYQDGTTYRGVLVDIAPPDSDPPNNYDDGMGCVAMHRTGSSWHLRSDTEDWGAPVVVDLPHRKFCMLKKLKEIR